MSKSPVFVGLLVMGIVVFSNTSRADDVLNFSEWKAQRIFEAEKSVQSAEAGAKTGKTGKLTARTPLSVY